MTASDLASFFAKRGGWRGSEIVDGKMWLGSATDVADGLAELVERGITDILNVADDVPNYHAEDPRFRYKQLHVKDFGMDRGIGRVFPESISFLEQVMQDDDRRVFIHCAAGQNRSVTIAIAAIMYLQKLSLKASYHIVLSRRPRVCPLKDNREALVAYEQELYPEAPPSMTVSSFQEYANMRHAPSKS